MRRVTWTHSPESCMPSELLPRKFVYRTYSLVQTTTSLCRTVVSASANAVAAVRVDATRPRGLEFWNSALASGSGHRRCLMGSTTATVKQGGHRFPSAELSDHELWLLLPSEGLTVGVIISFIGVAFLGLVPTMSFTSSVRADPSRTALTYVDFIDCFGCPPVATVLISAGASIVPNQRGFITFGSTGSFEGTPATTASSMSRMPFDSPRFCARLPVRPAQICRRE